jgi:hypothetical protein
VPAITSAVGLGRLVALVTSTVIAVGCGSSAATDRPLTIDVPDTVAIGGLPGPLSDDGPPPEPPLLVTLPGSTTTTEPRPDPIEGPIGDEVLGSRLLIIGDEVMASTAPRNGGIACDVLTSFGWDVELATEPGRFVDFGDVVLDDRLRPESDEDWDVVALMFGNEFDGDLDGFAKRLEELLDRIAPRPTILYTLTEVGEDQVALNEIIRDRVRFHPNVVVIDWA